MTTAIEKLRALGYELPKAPLPAASYVPVTRMGNLLYVSGQISSTAEGPVTGLLGETMNVVQGANAAELAVINVLAQIAQNGPVPLEKIKRVLKLNVLVASTPEFFEHHLVANGASNLLVAVLGDKGKHARAAYGVAALPFGSAVEIEAIIEVE